MTVFDLDDTLFKERFYVESGMRAIRRATGLSVAKIEKSEWTEGTLQVYRNHFPELSLPPATAYTLGLMLALGVKMAVITDGRAITQRNKFLALGLDRYIPPSRLLISEETGADKTAPDAFLKLMQQYPEEKCWMYVGDNPVKDFRYPNLLGWRTVMLRDIAQENIHPQVIPVDSSYAPQTTIDSISELIPYTCKNNL